jgi:hypothetical protein
MSANLQTYAIVQNGVVINTVVWDGGSDWTPPADSVTAVIPAGTYAGIGSTYSGGVFSAPPDTDPST